MEELCKSHPRAASILHEAGLEWNEAYRENDANREWAFPEQMCDGVQATDFTVINVVLKQFGQPVIEPLKKQ